MKVPIPKNEKTLLDPFYRYTREMAVLNESGGFYILTNIEPIIKSMKLDLNHFFKYLQKKIGQRVIKDKNGFIKLKSKCDIENILESYIVKTIICKKCELPECYNKICKSCGNKN
jgi:translation initiation factor 2 beta subunit (eIF-2beta)/eIF-5